MNYFMCFLILLSASVFAQDPSKNPPPNILLIVLDDVGFTDLGSFGGEIETPNLDKLAYEGTRLTQFYTAMTCSPTRAMLLTSADNHLVGLGNMHEDLAPNQKGEIGYEGYLNTRAANLAEVLKQAGYHTYMTGKWHLGLEEEHSPAARGFDNSFALLNGGGGHFDNLGLFGNAAQYREDGKLVKLPKDFYSTRFYTEKMLNYIKSDQGDRRPFFAYLAYSAVHWPLQAPEASIEKYKGRYSQGYDELHVQRIAGAITQGVVAPGTQSVPRIPGEPAWTELDAERRKVEQRKMEIYAAMLDDVDKYIGQVIEYLKSSGQYDNTIIFFMSDNGAEGHDLDRGLEDFIPWVEACCDNRYENMGRANSYVLTGPNWARASVGPAKLYKGFTTEGGIKAPAFITYPREKFTESLWQHFITVQDVMPTLLDLAGVKPPQGRFNQRDVLPITGRSFVTEKPLERSAVNFGWELMGKRAYRYGDWKVVYLPEPYGNGKWQLYNLSADASEQQDLAVQRPQKLRELVGHWEKYAKANNIIIPNWVSGY